MVDSVAQRWFRTDGVEVSSTQPQRKLSILTPAYSGIDAGIKIRPTEQDLKAIGPSYEAKWREDYLNAPDKPVMFIGPLAMSD